MNFNPIDVTEAAIEEVVRLANKLGLIWTMRPATVQSVIMDGNTGLFTGRLTCVFDGDTTAMNMISLCGSPPAGSRVMVVVIPPGGNYVVGRYQRPGVLLTELEEVPSSSNVTLTGVDQAVPGTLTTFTTFSDGAKYEVSGIFDFRETVAGATVCIGRLYVDGVVQSREALFQVDAVSDRATVAQTWAGTLTSAGDHTFELYVTRNAAAGTQLSTTPHTGMTVKIFE